MQELVKSGIFEGSSGQMTFTCSLPLLAAQKYHAAGQLVQWSIQRGGPGIPVLNVSYVLTGSPAHYNDVTDDCIKDFVNLSDLYHILTDFAAQCSPSLNDYHVFMSHAVQ